MAKEYFSGYSNDALGAAVKSLCSDVVFNATTLKKTFWCKYIQVTNEHATDTTLIDIYDMEEAAVDLSRQRGSIQVGPVDTVIVEYPAPGLKIEIELGATATNGTVNAYNVICGGYLI